jgi:hypothetical protein
VIDRDNIIKDFIEVELTDEGNFLKVKETLSRIGVSSKQSDNTLYQSCHILHKRGKYYIVHFKEMFYLDNGVNTMDEDDSERRNKIISLLEQWGLLKPVKPLVRERNPFVKVVPYGQKENWNLISKYKIGEI